MSVYQCMGCRKLYGSASGIVGLKKFPVNVARYLDTDVWKCPHCGRNQDSRDLTAFLGIEGTGSVRLLSADEVDRIRSRRIGRI